MITTILWPHKVYISTNATIVECVNVRSEFMNDELNFCEQHNFFKGTLLPHKLNILHIDNNVPSTWTKYSIDMVMIVL